MDLSTPSSNFSNFWQIFDQKLSLEIHFSNMWIYLWDCYIKCYFIIILSNSDLFLNVEEIIKTSRVNIYSHSKKAEKEMNVKCSHYSPLPSYHKILKLKRTSLSSPSVIYNAGTWHFIEQNLSDSWIYLKVVNGYSSIRSGIEISFYN